MNIKTILFALPFCVSIFAACAIALPAEDEGAAENRTVEGSALSPVTSTPSTEDVSPAAAVDPKKDEELYIADGRVFSYKRELGIAGLSDEWIIYTDGTLIESDGEKQKVDPQQVQMILEMSESLGLKNFYVSIDHCCDLMTHTVTIYSDGETKRIYTDDGIQPPEDVRAVIDELSQLILAAPRQ